MLDVRAEKETISEEPVAGAVCIRAHVTATEHLGAETVMGLELGGTRHIKIGWSGRFTWPHLLAACAR